jgi:hypothetical protein
MTLNPDLAGAVRKAHARDGNVVLQTIHNFLGRFVCYPCGHSQIAHSLWIVHTHLMDRWESTPRLAFLSAEPQSGKTRALEISEMLVPNSVATVNVSPAYLFRKVGCEENRPTMGAPASAGSVDRSARGGVFRARRACPDTLIGYGIILKN